MKVEKLTKSVLESKIFQKLNNIIKNNKLKKKKTITIISIYICVLIIIFMGLNFIVLKYDKVYSGVFVQGKDFGGLTKNEIKQKFNKLIFEYCQKEKISLEADKKEFIFNLQDIGLRYNQEKIVNKIYDTGREGLFITRLVKLISLKINKTDLKNIEYSFDKNLLDNKLEEFYKNAYVAPKEYSFNLDENNAKVVINSGTAGEFINKELVKNKISNSIRSGKSIKIKVQKDSIKQKKIDINTIYSQIIREAKNASVQLAGLKNYTMVQPIRGIKIDKQLLTDKLKLISQKENENITLPIKLVEPALNADQLHALLFKDNLSFFETKFGSEENRNTNIRLASQAINNTIVLPGGKFSFNDVVGPRTAARGYQVAHVYSNGKVEDGLGGGICQVSTTLHNAVIRQADLELISRSNHMFKVSYVPMGFDATVSYGSVEYVFKNNSNYPIRIDMDVYGNTVRAIIVGTKENNKSVTVNAEGSGLNWDTYQTIMDGNNVISSKRLYGSSYKELKNN